jgi:hypothetical protein
MRAYGEFDALLRRGGPLRRAGVGKLQLKASPGVPSLMGCSLEWPLRGHAQLAIQSRENTRGQLHFPLALGCLAYLRKEFGGFAIALEPFQGPDGAQACFGMAATSVDLQRLWQLARFLVELTDYEQKFRAFGFDPAAVGSTCRRCVGQRRRHGSQHILQRSLGM